MIQKKKEKIIIFQRVLLAYFAVTGLDTLNKLDKLPHPKHVLIDWIYMHQITEKISGKDII